VVLETADERRVNGAPPTLRLGQQASGKLWPLLARLEGGAVNIDDLMEWFIAWTHQTFGTAEVVNGSERFYLDHGKVFHDDSFYNARTAYFFDHFIFERRVSSNSIQIRTAEGITPHELLLAELATLQEAMPQHLIKRMQCFGNFRHSLFQILKVTDKSMVIQDLIFPAKISVTVKPLETFRGLEKRTIFQAFVFPFDNTHQLSSGIVIHPQKANWLIKRWVKQQRGKGDFTAKTLLSRLATVQIRHLRHRHVHPKLIYQAIKD
jgi:hypothetical protein